MRGYKPKHSGIGYEALDIESEACFVPDISYQLLDTLVEESIRNLGLVGDDDARAAAAKTSDTVGSVLARHNFGLYIPTATLGEALEFRNHLGESERHITDCDTSSLIYLTIAEALSKQASLVEITLPSGAGHNYVRWDLGAGSYFDWDTNGRTACVTPSGIASYEGKSMSRSQTLGYTYTLRASIWSRRGQFINAMTDFQRAEVMYPESPQVSNNLAWMVATKEFPERGTFRSIAMASSLRAVGIARTANNLDTLACVEAYVGDINAAKKTELEALNSQKADDFEARLAGFSENPPRDCTGAK